MADALWLMMLAGALAVTAFAPLLKRRMGRTDALELRRFEQLKDVLANSRTPAG